MFYIMLLLFFIIGLSVGSFLNVIILRIDRLVTVLRDRSHCPKCNHVLAWYDLIPVFSYLMLGGKCRYCKAEISRQYPIVELCVGVLFALLYTYFGLGLSLVYYLIIFSLLTVVFVYDLKTQMVPEYFVWMALVLSLLGGWYFGNIAFSSMLWGGLIGGGILAFLVIVSKEKWMGAGDIKIGLILGLLTGYPIALFGMFFSFLSGAIVGLIYIKLKGKTIKDALPFAPFLITSTLIAMLFGHAIVGWYMGRFFY